MKIGMKPLMIAGALLITAQAQASGNGAGAQADGAPVMCMGSSVNPGAGSAPESGCGLKEPKAPRPMPRYNIAS